MCDVILIGTELEQALTAITFCCGLLLEWTVVDQIELDCRENQVEMKHYVLHKARHTCVNATVDEYEPETVTLTHVGHRCKQFDAIVAAASMPGFGQHAFFLDSPVDAPRCLADTIHSTLNADSQNGGFGKLRLVAFHKTDAITRCFMRRSKILPTPYVICATNARTMITRQLMDAESKPYAIQGYR